MKYKIQDLIDIEQFQILQDRLNEIYPFPSAIIDNEGKVLTATAWQDICSEFHRKHEDCKKECIKSDQYILSHLSEANPAVTYQCPRGLVDNATPIIIDGIHYANFFTGQFFMTKPDMEFFKRQANRYGFDEEAYLKAVNKVPIWEEEQLKSYLYFIKGLIAIISESGLKKLKEIETRKQIEDSEERAGTILGRMQEGFLTTSSQNGKVVDANEAMCRMLGYTREEILKKSIKDIDADYLPGEIRHKIQHIIQTGSDHFETRYRRKDGTIFDVEVSVTYFPKTKLLFGFHSDITERKQAEKALREESLRLSGVIKGTNVGTWEWNVQTGETLFNNRWAEIIGYTLEEISPVSIQTWMKFAHPDDLKTSDELLEKHFRGTLDYYEFESRMRHKDGYWIWVLDRGKVTTWTEDGKPLMMFGTHQDITARKKMDAALRESEQKYRNVVELAQEGIWVIDAENNIVYLNPRMAEMLQYTVEEMQGLSLTSFMDDAGKKIFAQKMDRHRRGIKETYPFEFITKGGNRIYVTISTSPLHDDQGAYQGSMAVISDITERKRTEEEKRSLEEQLQRAEKMEALGTLAGGVAHDLNNVLGVIVGFSELLIHDVESSSPLRHGLMNILDGSKRAAAIVQDLLTLARRGVSSRQILNLNKIIINGRNDPEFENLSSCLPSVKITSDLEPDLLNIYGSDVHLSKAFFNLVSNACEAMRKGGTLTIKTSNQYLDRPIHGYDEVREGDYVVLSVSDTGEGIPAADLKRIFEPFYTKKVMGRRSGTGLGLAVVWGTVKDHHGYIDVQSEEGKGSTFILYFPVTREEITAEEISVPVTQYLGKGEAVLIIDDVRGQRDLASTMLRKLNYNVTSVPSGEEAVVYLKEHSVDLLVLDMIMDPGLDGLDTYRKILEIHPQQKAIIVSGFSETDRVHAAQALGAGAYIKKPYTTEKLGLAVRKEMDRAV